MSTLIATENTPPHSAVKERDASLDALKGFLILLVIIGHSGIGGALPHATDSFLGSMLMRLVGLLPPIYYFHIALFFSVSAVHTGPATAGKIIQRIWGLTLLFAFWMCWPVFSYFIKACYDNPHLALWPFWVGNVKPWLMDRLIRTAWGDWSHAGILWFIPSLAVFFLLCSAVAKVPQIKWARISSLLLIFAGWFYLVAHAAQIAVWHVQGVIPWGVDIAAYLLPLGLLHRWVYQNRGRCEKISYPVLLTGVIAGELLLTVFEPLKVHSPYPYRIDFAQFSVAVTPLGIAGFYLLTTALLVFTLRVRPIHALAWLGRYSLPIYVMHMNFIDYDLIKAWGLETITTQWLTLGSIEALRYTSRLASAITLPILISVTVGSIVPQARVFGFIAPRVMLAWRQRFFTQVVQRFSKRKLSRETPQ